MAMSMTGFGRGEVTAENITATVEIKSVNHRYFEFNVRTPRAYAFLDDKLKSLCSSKITRGKIDMFVSIDTTQFGDVKVSVNKPLAQGYIDAIREIAEQNDLSRDVSAYSVARLPEVLTLTHEDVDEELVFNIVKQAAEIAIDKFIQMRMAEGERLKQDVLGRANDILRTVDFIESQGPKTLSAYTQRLEKRMREVLEDRQIDEARLITEVAIFADKIAVDEETVRLRSHIKSLNQMFESNEAIGRKLDFLIQEMNREINTIGSKAQDVEIAQKVVETKSEIEKIREQIQNIE